MSAYVVGRRETCPWLMWDGYTKVSRQWQLGTR